MLKFSQIFSPCSLYKLYKVSKLFILSAHSTNFPSILAVLILSIALIFLSFHGNDLSSDTSSTIFEISFPNSIYISAKEYLESSTTSCKSPAITQFVFTPALCKIIPTVKG